MDDATIDGLEVQELDHTEEETFGPHVPGVEEETFAPHVPGGHQRWQGQLRRTGSPAELPGPQRYRDYPAWLTTLAKAPAVEEDLTA